MKIKRITINCDAKNFGCMAANKVGGKGVHYWAHCSDNIPKFIPTHGSSLHLDIDPETGRILNWIPITDEQIMEGFKEANDVSAAARTAEEGLDARLDRMENSINQLEHKVTNLEPNVGWWGLK